MRTIQANLHPIILILMTLILGFLLALNLSGCAKESFLIPVDDPVKIHAKTADELMLIFKEAYGGRDIDLYAQLLHPDFIFTFDPEGRSEMGPSYEFFTREDELICAGNMFCGEAIVNSQGQAQPAITGIAFEHWEQVGPWELEPDGHLRGVFQLDLLITRQDASNFQIRGNQIFTVAVNEAYREVGGNLPYYQIIGWQDLGSR